MITIRIEVQCVVYSGILPPFSLIRDFGKQNTRGNVSKIRVIDMSDRNPPITATSDLLTFLRHASELWFVNFDPTCRLSIPRAFYVVVVLCSYIVEYAFVKSVKQRQAEQEIRGGEKFCLGERC